MAGERRTFRIVPTITAFDSEDAAVESNAVSATWVQENVPNLVANPPRVTAGETTWVTAEVPALPGIR